MTRLAPLACQMTRAQLAAVPSRPKRDQEIRCSSLIFLPQRKIHDSGFRCMDFVACDAAGEAFARCAGRSDKLEIEGVGGHGRYKNEAYIPPAGSGWEIDLLAKSGCYRMWPANDKENEILVGRSLSSLEIFQVRRDGSEPRDLRALGEAAWEIVAGRMATHHWAGEPAWLLRRLAQDHARLESLDADRRAREAAPPPPPAPIPLLLWCPECRARHVDAGEFAAKPHHTHACQNCGHCWRPAIVATVGVQFLPGFKDAP